MSVKELLKLVNIWRSTHKNMVSSFLNFKFFWKRNVLSREQERGEMDGDSGDEEGEVIWLWRSDESGRERWGRGWRNEPGSWFERWGDARRNERSVIFKAEWVGGLSEGDKWWWVNKSCACIDVWPSNKHLSVYTHCIYCLYTVYTCLYILHHTYLWCSTALLWSLLAGTLGKYVSIHMVLDRNTSCSPGM